MEVSWALASLARPCWLSKNLIQESFVMPVCRGRGLLQLPFGTMGAPSPCVHIPFWSKTAENGPQLKPQICMMEGGSVVGRGVVQLFGHDPFTDQGADTNTRMVRRMK